MNKCNLIEVPSTVEITAITFANYMPKNNALGNFQCFFSFQVHFAELSLQKSLRLQFQAINSISLAVAEYEQLSVLKDLLWC